MAGLTDLIGLNQAPTQKLDAAGDVAAGLKTGIQLATAKEQVDSAKMQVESQKNELITKQAATTNSLLTNLARANPIVAKKMIKQVREQLLQLGADPDIADYTISDDANRQRQIAINNVLSGKISSNPEASSKYVQDAAAVLGWDGAMNAWDNNQKKSMDAQKIAQADKQLSQQNTQFYANLSSEEKRAHIAADAAAGKANVDKGEKVDLQIEKLSKRLTDDSIPEVVNSIKSIDKQVGGLYEEKAAEKLDKIAGSKGLAATFKIPWTQIAPLESSAISKEDMPLFQEVSGLRNAYLKLRSGGAVTDPEADRFLQELGQGSIRSGTQLQTGIQRLSEAVKSTVLNTEAGYSPEAVATFAKRGGTVSSASFPSRKEKAGKNLAADPDIEARLKSLPPGADINLARAALIKAKTQSAQKAK